MAGRRLCQNWINLIMNLIHSTALCKFIDLLENLLSYLAWYSLITTMKVFICIYTEINVSLEQKIPGEFKNGFNESVLYANVCVYMELYSFTLQLQNKQINFVEQQRLQK